MATKPHPQYTAKKIKTIAGRDGIGFIAELYENGEKIADVLDEGWGSHYKYAWVTREAEQKMRRYAKSRPAKKDPQLNVDIQPTVDSIVYEIVQFDQFNDKLKRDCKNHVCFKLFTHKTGEYTQIRDTEYTASVKSYIISKYGALLDEIYNERFIEKK